MADDDRVALFPLKTVLYPGGVLPLRIFEPRYLDMIGRCLRAEQSFGVLSIVEGSEVGEALTVSIGTLADIVDWHQEHDGILGIVVTGTDRFAVEKISMRDDGLYVGSITVLAPEPAIAVPPEHADLVRLLQQALPRIEGYSYLVERYDDASWVGYRLAELLPMALEDKQECLEMEDALARLSKLRGTFN